MKRILSLLLTAACFGGGELASGQESAEEHFNATRIKAEQGDAEAQNSLAWMYSYGVGVPKDYEEAEKWYRKAAKQGHAKAQYKLGVMYNKGEGVPMDLVEAYAWFLLAKVNGDRESGKVIPNLEKRLTKEQGLAAINKGQERAAELHRLYGGESEEESSVDQ